MKRLLFYFCCSLASALFIVSCGDPLSPSANMSVKTGKASCITCLSAVLSGDVKYSGEAPSDDLEMGILISENSGVLLNTATKIQAVQDSIVWDGSRARFSVRLQHIKRETKYYYRCYISRDGVIEYGKTKSFTSKDVSTLIKTEAVTDIDAQNATFHASLNLTDIESDRIYYGFAYKKASQDDHNWAHHGNDWYGYTIESDGGHFSAKIEGLSSMEEYSYYAYVTIDGYAYHGETKTFSCGSIDAEVLIGNAVNITEVRADIYGDLSIRSPGDYYRAVCICYSPDYSSQDSLYSLGQRADLPLKGNTFSSTLRDLLPGTTYHYAAFALIRDTYSYTQSDYYYKSEVKEFRTLDFSADVTTLAADSIGCWTACLFGELQVNSYDALNQGMQFVYSNQVSSREAMPSSGNTAPAVLENGFYRARLNKLSAGDNYYYMALANVCGRQYCGEVKSFSTVAYPGTLVDMGLNVLWTSCNLGATAPENVGNYYAWGETSTKPVYDWESYAFCKGTRTTMTKYSTSYRFGIADSKKALESEDDVATVMLGSGARLPTQKDWNELSVNSTREWVTRNGVNGVLLTSKKTGAQLFFPALDERFDAENAGTFGCYWTPTLYTTSCDSAFSLHFDASTWIMNHTERCAGLPVRAVVDKLE